MDMNSGHSTERGSSLVLSAEGVDFSNYTQALKFLSEIIDDEEMKVIGNRYARYFWYGVVFVVGIAAIFHWTTWLVLRSRLKAAANGQEKPAEPKNVLLRWFATITALARESTYLQFTPRHRRQWLQWFRVPPLGTILLVLTHLGVVLALEFINNDVPGAKHWQVLGVRAAWLAVAQVPLMILLAGKCNIFTPTTGVSYERLNVLHRWTARIMLLMAIFHFGFMMHGWSIYGLVKMEWTTDTCPPTGIAALALLIWINLSTLAPFRHFSWEFFVWQHLITFFGFIIALAYHLPTTATWSRIYIYIPSALYIIDRLLRTAWLVWVNKRRPRATLTRLEGGVTKVVISNAAIKTWSPGSHVLLSLPSLGWAGWAQTHPATIVSTPKSDGGDLVFILKSHKGFTRRIMDNANTSREALLPKADPEGQMEQNLKGTYRAVLSGPYGGGHQDFAAFDSICLIAGSTGVAFTSSILQDIAARAAVAKLPLRRIRFVWCIKTLSCAKWVSTELSNAAQRLQKAGVYIEISIHVTCDDALTDGKDQIKACGCQCDKSKGPCCCVSVAEDADETSERADETSPAAGKAGGVGRVVDSPSSSVADLMSSGSVVAVKRSWLPGATFYSGHPDFHAVLTALLNGADGESGVAVCGPVGMSAMVRAEVVQQSDDRAIHKGTGAQGCYLHVESFS